MDVADSGVPLDGGESLGAAEAPCVVAAARELFEEAGILAVPGAQKISPAERKEMREALLRRPAPGEKAASFGDFLARHGLRLDARWFSPAGRWVTPPALPIRSMRASTCSTCRPEKSPRSGRASWPTANG